MAPKINPFLPTFLSVISIILISFPRTTISDNPCPYPCYPPPTGTTTTPTPVTTTPSPPSTTTTTYSPPAYPTPTGYYPYNPPPSTYTGGGGGYGYGPPPPDPILPYFPFYYKNGAHRDAWSATSSHRARSTTLMAIATTSLLVIVMFLLS